MTKEQIRKRVLRRLKQQKEDVQFRESEAIRRKALRLSAFRRAKTICCYVSLPYEVQTWRLIEAMLNRGKRAVVPMTKPGSKRLRFSEVRDISTELVPAAYGVWQPRPEVERVVSLSEVDLVFVPGLAFDRYGYRLGHGHGYFDRFLARLPKTTPTIGLAYRCQILDRLPVTAHDRAVSRILTA